MGSCDRVSLSSQTSPNNDCFVFSLDCIPLALQTQFPEAWLEYISWLEDRSRYEDAVQVSMRAAEAVPSCISLRLMQSDLLEATSEHDQAKECIESLIAELHQQALIASDDDEEEVQGDKDDDNGGPKQIAKENEAQKEHYNHISLAYIHYMRLLRRTEGRDSARKVFANARKEAHCRWQVYAAAAELEYRTENDTRIPKNIFELSLKRFGHDADFAVAYADFLTRINDLGNARAVFERSLELVQPARLKQIWDR